MNTRGWLHFSLTAGLLLKVSGADFVNLDFEKGNIDQGLVETLPGGVKIGRIEAWMPGWRYHSGDEGEPINTGVIYLNEGASVNRFSLYDEAFVYGLPLEGKLAFAAFRPTAFEGRFRISLSQRGEIPLESKSLHYRCLSGSWEVRIDGVKLDLYEGAIVDANQTLREVWVDVAAWAGQEVELKFSQSLGYDWNVLDSIGFSPEPVIPEPRLMGLVMMGGGVLGILAGPGRGRPDRRLGEASPQSR